MTMYLTFHLRLCYQQLFMRLFSLRICLEEAELQFSSDLVQLLSQSSPEFDLVYLQLSLIHLCSLFRPTSNLFQPCFSIGNTVIALYASFGLDLVYYCFGPCLVLLHTQLSPRSDLVIVLLQPRFSPCLVLFKSRFAPGLDLSQLKHLC